MTVRRALPALAACAVAVVLAATGASPAAAHAVLVGSSPGDGQVLSTPPKQVRLEFNEPVSAGLGGLTVLDTDGARVDEGDPAVDRSGRILTVTLPDALDDGTYIANYRVVSADGHPVTGAIVFGVGGGTVLDTARAAGLRASGDPGFEVAGTLARAVTYAAALLAAGLAFFLGFLHDQAGDRWSLTPWVRIACVVAAAGMVATIAVQAALATGRGAEAMVDPASLRGVLTEGLGWSGVVLLAGLALVHLSTDTDRLLVAQALAFYGWLAVGISFVFWGHATSAPNEAVAVVADVVHTLAAAVWFGGLVGVWATLRRRSRAAVPTPPAPAAAGGSSGTLPIDGGDDGAAGGSRAPSATTPGSTAVVISRFSAAAAASVIVLAVAGVALAVQELDGPANLVRTTYGRVLAGKLCVVAAVVAVAAFNRWRLVPAVRNNGPEGWRRLSRTTGLEAAGIVVVLALTAVLVNLTPSRLDPDDPDFFNQTTPLASGGLNLIVTPADPGPNTLHLQFVDGAGLPDDVGEAVTVELSLPERGVAPIRRDATFAGPGHFIVEGVELPLTGTWQVDVIARISPFEEERAGFRVPVR